MLMTQRSLGTLRQRPDVDDLSLETLESRCVLTLQRVVDELALPLGLALALTQLRLQALHLETRTQRCKGTTVTIVTFNGHFRAR